LAIQSITRAQTGQGRAPSHFRYDIQGLRAVAVLLVILNHAGLPWLPGGFVGVDVFFVISGFVITQSLLGGEHARGVSLTAFYAARARRILPMGTLVILLTLLASWAVMNYIRAEQVVTDSLWASFFLANFHFAFQGTDYFSADVPPSPLQHYWSLNVEEQFYIVWPILVGMLIFGLTMRKRSGRRLRPVPTARLLVVFGIIIAASFAWSVLQTASNPTFAYFSPLTRAWELALGGALVVASSHIERVPAVIRSAATWVGLAGVLGAAFLFTDETPFPGFAVALPVLATALIIGGGIGQPAGGAAIALRVAPMRAIGNWSYSIYLWHWPILVIAAAAAGAALPLWGALTLVALSIGLSYLSYRYVEQPFSRTEWLKDVKARSLALWPAAITLCILAVLLVSTSLRDASVARAVDAAAAEPAPVFSVAPNESGTAGAQSDPVAEVVAASVAAVGAAAPIPSPLSPPIDAVGDDVDELVGCSASAGQTTNDICTYGDGGADRTLVIVGDSHALHWVPALDAAGKAHGWRVLPVVKHGCTITNVTLVSSNGQPNTECDTWREWAIGEINTLDADKVIISQSVPGSISDNGTRLTDSRINDMGRLWTEGLTDSISRLSASGAEVSVLSDVPGVQSTPQECLLARDATMATCSWPRLQRNGILNSASERAAQGASVAYIDLTPWFCANGQCPLVIGSTIAYRDTNHISATYARQLSESLAAKTGLL